MQPHFAQDDGQVLLSVHALMIESRGPSSPAISCTSPRSARTPSGTAVPTDGAQAERTRRDFLARYVDRPVAAPAGS